MIISSTSDYRAAAQKRLPPFLFHYIDGGAYAEQTPCGWARAWLPWRLP